MPSQPPDPAATAGHSSPSAQLVSAYAELANLLTQGPDVVAFLQQVAESASRSLRAPIEVGITLRRGPEISTVAATGEMASQADELQYGQGHGPCLQAMRDVDLVHVPDLASDARWGSYRVQAVAHGVRSSVSWPLVVDGASVGALNLYSAEPDHFSADDVAIGHAFTRQVSTLLDVVVRQAKASQLTDQMQQALVSRAAIDQAMGILMAQQRCTSRDAFALLRRVSQHRNRKMADVAGDLIEATTQKRPRTPSEHDDARGAPPGRWQEESPLI